jgi:histidinol-phosphate/aromatic aminotransferase/cobyric acid decarboxylase-like protein
LKHLDIRLLLRTDDAPDWCIQIRIDREQLDGVVRQAAGLDGGPEWRIVELFVQDAVRRALLTWAEKTIPAVERIRTERDLTYAALGRTDLPPSMAFARLENFARVELNAKEVECEAAFAAFVFRHFGGYWREGNRSERASLGIPERVDALVAELARKAPRV